MISRAEYKAIKGMNREELDAYLTSTFNKGYNNGVTTMASCTIANIDKGLKMTPGIGYKRYNLIMQNITKCFREQDAIDSKEE